MKDTKADYILCMWILLDLEAIPHAEDIVNTSENEEDYTSMLFEYPPHF